MLWLLLVAAILLCHTVHAADHVLVIGIDGLPAHKAKDYIERDGGHFVPNIVRFVREGVFTFKCRSLFPTQSGPNWASHIKSAEPELTGMGCALFALYGSRGAKLSRRALAGQLGLRPQ